MELETEEPAVTRRFFKIMMPGFHQKLVCLHFSINSSISYVSYITNFDCYMKICFADNFSFEYRVKIICNMTHMNR